MDFHPASHMVTIDINELCARPGSMYTCLASSSNILGNNLNPLIECKSPPYVRPMVMFGSLIVIFPFSSMGFRYNTVSPVSDMAVLSRFGGW